MVDDHQEVAVDVVQDAAALNEVHDHKIVKIKKVLSSANRSMHLHEIEMDCPVYPIKTVLTTRKLKVGGRFSIPILIMKK